MQPHTPKQILCGSNARKRILYGAQMLAKTTAATYGPHGRNCILDRMAGLLATKDGVTVAREVALQDPLANVGCQILKEACVQVNNQAGDGTTSTAVITAEILRQGHKLVSAGHDPMSLSKGINAAAEMALSIIPDLAAAVEDQEVLEQVALIASNGDIAVSTAMAEAVMAAGEHGTVTIEDGNSVGIELVYKDGMEVDNGVASKTFLGGEQERTLEGPLVACIGKALTKVEEVKDVMEVASQWPDRPLILIAEHIEGDALKMMTMNDQQGVMHCVALNAPGFQFRKKDYIKDIAALAGADYIDPDVEDITHWNAEWFGAFRRATVEDRKATFIAYEEATEMVEERCLEIEGEAMHAVSEFDRDRCNERRAKLIGGLVVMQVGGVTEVEMKERRARIEDSLNAVRAALESGVVPGAGTTYLFAAEYLRGVDQTGEDTAFRAGWYMFCDALEHPLRALARNAGQGTGDVLIHRVSKARQTDKTGWVGWDALKNDIRDLAEFPSIIDPTDVVCSVIRAASSSAAILLTVETGITDIP